MFIDWSSTINGDVSYWYTEVGAHLAKLRVTNDEGFVSEKGVAINIGAADLGAQFSPPVVSNVSASVLSGAVPLAISFTGIASDADGYIMGYEWDFDGDGEYDSYSDSSGNITYTYREAGLYGATFRAIDDDGLTDTGAVAIEVLLNGSTLKAKAHASPATCRAPREVTFTTSGSSGSITVYEWDFNGDGTYDWSSTTGDPTTYTYGEAGTYEARLRVTDTNGISKVDTASIRVKQYNNLTAPEAIASVDPANGIIPFDAEFTHSSSIGNIVKYEWDFEGDKNYDTAPVTVDNVIHVYPRPGYYLAVLKTTDANGLTNRAYVPLVSTGPNQAGATYSSYFTTPKSGQRVYGNSVTGVINILPNNKNQSVHMQHRISNAGGPWNDCVTYADYPYRLTVDTTVLPIGPYDLRAPVNDISDKAKVSLVIVDPVNWDIREDVNGGGERIKQVRIDNNEDTVIELVDGTSCTIESGTLGADDIITLKTPNGSGRLVEDGVNTILYHREFTLSSITALNKPIKIVIPYDDADNDGIVDGLGIPEADLKLYTYNETTGEWEALADFTVYTDENYVESTVSHLSIFGIGLLGGGGGVLGGGGGLLGVASAIGGGVGGNGRSCFIATATYGTVMASEVQSLRYFRDNYMLTNAPGEFMIDIYEKYSPPIARVIEESTFLKGMVRYYLRPIITFARFINMPKVVNSHD